MMRRICRILLATTVALTLSTLPALALLARADVNGNCSASINGVDVRGLSANNAGDAIDVKEHTAVPVTMQSAAGITHLKIQIEFAGVPWTVRDEPTSGTSWQNTVPVDDYDNYGVGLYKVIGQSEGPAGKCSGSALVKVAGNPLRTVAGAAAAGLTALGAVGLGVAGVASALGGQGAIRVADEAAKGGTDAGPDLFRTKNPLQVDPSTMRFCLPFVLPALLLTGAAMAAGPGAPPAPKQGVRLPRAAWRPRISVVGVLGGLLAGAGIVVLLQQYAVVYPTRAVAIEGLVGGLALGLIIPSLMRVFAVRRVNRAIARAEWRLSSAPAHQPAPAAAARIDEAEAQQQPPAIQAEPDVDEAPAEPAVPPDEAAG
jgi:hypothetical protein